MVREAKLAIVGVVVLTLTGGVAIVALVAVLKLAPKIRRIEHTYVTTHTIRHYESVFLRLQLRKIEQELRKHAITVRVVARGVMRGHGHHGHGFGLSCPPHVVCLRGVR